MRASVALVAATSVALALVGCSGSTDPFRIGILSDCYGPFSSAHEVIVASAELPLIERGGRLTGQSPTSGVEDATVAGRPVELLVGCVTGTQDVIPEARRLVEESGADAVIGPLYPNHGPVLHDYARTRPDTVFLIQPSGAPEVTLADPLPNVFRFTLDTAQEAAGLGSYAYRELGWRTAATIADDTPYGWGNVAGFVAEFCAVGGRVVDREWVPLATDPSGFASTIPSSVDGVYLGAAISPMHGFVRQYSARHRDSASRLLANATLLYDQLIVARSPGLVAAGSMPFAPTPALQAHIATFAKAFPTIPAATALAPLGLPYRDGVEAVLQALEDADGSDEKLLSSLGALRLNTPTGRVRLDANHQAVGPNYLSRVDTDAQGKPQIRTLRVVPDVEQTFGGYFTSATPPPSRTAPACRRSEPPAWAR
jgi:branched-chain amino acid transport system substrate-binding protein